MVPRSIITSEQIDIWRSVPKETPRLEFKEAKNQFDSGDLFNYCVAIANEGGGHLLLGVKNDPPRPVVGSRAINNLSGMEEKIFQHVRFRVELHEVDHPDGRIVVCRIPSRPRGTAYHRDGRYLMRCGEQLLPMSEDQLREIFSEGKPDWLEEHTISGLTEEGVTNLLDLSAYFRLSDIPYPTSDHAAVARLVADRLVDEADGKYSIRRICALILAKDLKLYPDLERKGARVNVYNSSDKLSQKLDQVGRRGYAVGFRRLIKFIADQLPQNEMMEDAVRKKMKLIPDVILRELVSNALIHQDFEITGTSVMIDIYADRIEVTNPGRPQIPPERFIDECRSRNQRFALLMRNLGICEEKGSGIDRVVRLTELLQLAAPDFRIGFESTTVVITGPRDFDDLGRNERIRACYQHCVLRYITSGPMTNKTLRERFKLPESKSGTISEIIAMAVEAKLIKQDGDAGGSRKFARYVPIWA